MELVFKKQFIMQVGKLPKKIQISVKEILDKLETCKNIESIDLDIKPMEGQKEDETPKSKV